MASKTYCYQFSDQKVFAPENAPLAFQINGNYAIVAMNNYFVSVYDISNSNFTLINLFPVCGCVIKIDYCIFGDYIITLESKDHSDINSNVNYSIRTYHNWRNGGTQNKMRFRDALGAKCGTVSAANVINPDKSNALAESVFLENMVEVLEFLHLNHPKCFAVYTNSDNSKYTSSAHCNQDNICSNVAISENSYIHLYKFCQPYRKSMSLFSDLSPKQPKTKTNENNMSLNDNFMGFQHLYTVNFSFEVHHLSLYSRVLVVASLDKVQAIQILEEKQRSEMFSNKLELDNLSATLQIELDIEKCWLTSISTARKTAATKRNLRPKEILGPTQNLDTASITLLRYADSKEMSFETLLFRRFLLRTTAPIVQNIHLVRVINFDKLGLFIVLKNEIILYSFCLKTNEVSKIAEYDFKKETIASMAFSDHVNLLHVAFTSGDLATYSSRLCAEDLFESNNISKRVSLTRLGKVTLMGLTDVKSSGSFLLACCKFIITEENESENIIIVSPDSWNFYLFTQPPKTELKTSIIAHANHKGNRKMLQMLLCSLLVFPSKDEVNNKVIEDIIIGCLKSETFYMELVPNLLLRNGLSIVDTIKIFQILETKELYDDNLFQLYAKQKLVNADFSGLNEEHFRWIVIKIMYCSIDLLFNVLITNDVEDFLKADLLAIEGLEPNSFESIFIKILYYSAHSDYDLIPPLFSQLDQKELKTFLKSHSHLIFNKKHHTSFGWVLNLYSPQIYARIFAFFFLNDKNNHGYTDLEMAKQVGQCSHVLLLEEIFRKLLKKNELIHNPNRFCKNKFQYENKKSFDFSQLVCLNYKKDKTNEEFHKNYVNQLLLLYHEFSYNAVEFCPHKYNQICRKIPPWLKSLRYHSILNQLPPFNGINPFTTSHNSVDGCYSVCCQSYLIRLQCLMSWKESYVLESRNVIEATCEYKNHPAWKSLKFLLLHHTPKEQRNILDIFNFINVPDSLKETNLVDLYFSNFGCELSTAEWYEIISNQFNKIYKSKTLKYACTIQGLEPFLEMIDSLKQANIMNETEHREWLERAGKSLNKNKLFNTLFKQIIEEAF